MSRPYRELSVDGATGTGPGEEHAGKGHVTLGLFVVASNLDSANDSLTVRLEVEGPDGEWSPIRDKDGTVIGELTQSEFEDVDGDGTTFNSFLYVHGVPAPSVRANVTSFTDAAGGDLSVDAYVHAANNGGTGSDYLGP